MTSVGARKKTEMEKPRVKCEIRDGIAEVMLTRGTSSMR
jgi:hypothetical protein